MWYLKCARPQLEYSVRQLDIFFNGQNCRGSHHYKLYNLFCNFIIFRIRSLIGFIFWNGLDKWFRVTSFGRPSLCVDLKCFLPLCKRGNMTLNSLLLNLSLCRAMISWRQLRSLVAIQSLKAVQFSSVNPLYVYWYCAEVYHAFLPPKWLSFFSFPAILTPFCEL